MTEAGKEFEIFAEIVARLRSDSGCPWDREQTPSSLKRYFLEETRELLEAIDTGEPQHIKEELGDLLYLIILLTHIHSEKKLFSLRDVIGTIHAKMVRRHPHVFADAKIGSLAELRQKWLEIKDGEKRDGGKSEKN